MKLFLYFIRRWWWPYFSFLLEIIKDVNLLLQPIRELYVSDVAFTFTCCNLVLVQNSILIAYFHALHET